MFFINLFKRFFRFFKLRKMRKEYRRLCEYTLLLEKLNRENEPLIDSLRRVFNG